MEIGSHPGAGESRNRSSPSLDAMPVALPLAVLAAEAECIRMVGMIGNAKPTWNDLSHSRSEEASQNLDVADSRSVSVSQSTSVEKTVSTVTALSDGGLPNGGQLGRFELRELLAEGTFGRVYVAHDPVLNRRVAVKVPVLGKSRGHNPAVAFLREARAAALLQHPGIVSIFDVGATPDGSTYIAMELVAGRSLKDELDQGPLNPNRAAAIIEQAAEAVHHAHKRSVVHRDLKPANILLDSDGRVKITDFGLALPEEEQRAYRGEFAGSLAYMSPEQARGESHRLDGRTDIWSLGIILYELLTGRRPFNGSKAQLLDEIQHRDPKPPSQYVDSIPPRLEELCLKCLQKSVTARFSTGRQLAQEIRRCQQPAGRALPGFANWRTGIAIGAITVLLTVGTVMLVNRKKAPATPIPFRPVQLLEQSPKELFVQRNPFEGWYFDGIHRHVFMDSKGLLPLTLGSTETPYYKFQVKISKNAAVGSAGIFFGLHALADRNGHHIHECQRIYLDFLDDGRLKLARGTIEFEDVPGQYLLPSTREFKAVLIPVTQVRGTELEIVIFNGSIYKVRWDGQDQPELCDPIATIQKGEKTVYSKGDFGILNVRGASRFSDAQFTLLNTSLGEMLP